MKLPPLLAAAWLLLPAVLPAAVQINEFMADNPGRPNDPNAQIDMDANSPGWVEMYNNGAAAVTLTGWALSDDPANPGKWIFAAPVAPATVHTTIAASGYKLVYCGGLERNVANVEPHTSFGLDDSGYVLLSQPDGSGGWTVVSRIGIPASGMDPAAPYPNQRKAVSYGYPGNDSALAPVYFENDTPGAANAATGVTEFCGDTVFDIDRGIYDAPFTLTITCATPGATIAWTVNGNRPSPTAGTQAPAADAVSTPVATINITGTTIIRARAWKAGLGMSNVDTQTYIFASQVLTQTGPLPSMGLTAADTYNWGAAGGDLRSPPGPDWEVDPAVVNHAVAANRLTTDDLKKLPVVSVVTPWVAAFGPQSTAVNPPPVGDRGFYVGAAVGVANEGADRFASMEFINPTGDSAAPNAVKGFQADGNVHVFGGTSQNRWKSYKLSMRFKAQEAVEYNVYGDDASSRQDLFILDARLNQAWVHPSSSQQVMGDYVRDHVMSDLQNSMGGSSFHSRAVHYFLNGLYWGLYILHEKPDDRFMADYSGGDPEDWDIFKHNGGNGVDGGTLYMNVIASGLINPAVALGSSSDPGYFNCTALKNFEDLLDLAGLGRVAPNPNPAPNLATQAAYEAVAAKLDIPQFIDYMMLNFVAANTDWAHKNLYASYNRTSPRAKWRWHSWDAEHVFKSATDNAVGRVDTFGPTAIHQKLLANAEYKLAFADAIQKRIFNNGILSTQGLRAAFNQRFAEIEPAGVRGESARWGDNRVDASPYTYTGAWTTEKNRILNTVLPGRGSTAATPASTTLNQMKAAGLYPATAAPEFRNAATDTLQHGGMVPASFQLKIHNPVGGASVLYYTLDGSDPRTAWSSAVSPAAQTYSGPIALGVPKTVKARILNGAVWSALNEAFFSVGTVPASAANLVVSEFNYRPSAPTVDEQAAGHTQRSRFEYIELLNIGASAVSLDGVRFGAGLDYVFDAQSAVSVLAAGERVLIVARREAFELRYGAGKPIAGEFQLSSNLDDSGERIEVLAADNSAIKDFTYNDRLPWPMAADGGGYSLVLIRPHTNPDHNTAQSWRPSAAVAGNPGGSDVVSFAAWKSSTGVTEDYGDDDNDGATNAAEYVLMTNPASASSRPVLTGAVQTVFVDPGLGLPPVPVEFLTLTFDRNPRADDCTCTPVVSTDLVAWNGGFADMVRVSITPNPDGTQTEVWRPTVPAAGDPRRFAGLRVTAP
jgi:CotH kinase protein/Chitobiase/beta-hexosaminidase C-terminal domain/Fn3 associated